MLDIRFIRENADLVKEAVRKRNDSAPVDEILELDAARRQKITELEDFRRERKASAKKGPGSAEEGRELRDRIRSLEEESRNIETRLNELLLQVPNMPHPSVQEGKDESGNITVRTWSEPKEFDFTPVPHWDLGEKLGIIDFERGVKISGSRFYILSGLGARLQRAVIAFMLDLHTTKHGYREIYPPYMVKRECMYGAGQLPKFADNIYHDEEDDFWFVGTAEIPLTNIHRDEILSADMLPIYYTPSRRNRKRNWKSWSGTPRKSARSWGCLTGWCSSAPENSDFLRRSRTIWRCGRRAARNGWR
jgi:seryl-tRNA synthetase